MKKGQKTQKKLEFRLKNKENRQKAGLKSCFGALIGTNRDESAFLGRRAGRRVSVSKSGLSRRDRDGWQVWKLSKLTRSWRRQLEIVMPPFSLPWCTLYVNVKLSKACAELKITYQLYGLSIRNPIRKVRIAEPL